MKPDLIRLPFENKLLTDLTQNSLLRKIHTTFFLILLMAGFNVAYSQKPVPNFTASTTSGCATLTVSFRDQSTNNPTKWYWQFSHDQGLVADQISQAQNPTISFGTPGKYTVTLVAENASGPERIIKAGLIDVFPSARIGFNADRRIACSPATIRFTDGSTIPNGASITSWLWNFGDGGTSTQRNPTYTYTNLGYYNVTLTVTTSSGCTVTASADRFIRVIGGVKPNFDFSRSQDCSSPVSVNFINQTVAPGVLQHQWTLGNNTTSTDKNPVTSYNSPGTYNVKLVTSSSYGCRDSITKPIVFNTTTTDFNTVGSVCVGRDISFTNASTPSPVSSLWDFGDGTSSREINPLKTFTTPGVYTVTLTNNYAECTGTVTKNITVTTSPTIDFTADKTGGCQVPVTIRFTDPETNSTGWLWDFGDGGISNEKNPTHTYTTAGNYTVTLSLITAAGCPATVVKTNFIRIAEPGPLVISGIPAGGCVPFTINPTAAFAGGNDPITSYQWNLGSGGTSTSATPSFTFSTPGTYNLTLRVTTANGCTKDTTINAAVKAGTKPTVDFSIDKTTGCAGDEYNFTSLATPADEWIWNFGDGASSSDENPSHKYLDTGLLTVQLIAFNNGCSDTLTKADFVTIEAPVALFEPIIDCNNRLRVQFDNTSITDASHGVTTYFWDFGNGQTSTAEDPVMTYSGYRKYTVKLVATDPICSYEREVELNLFELANDFTVNKTSICRGERFRLSFTGLDPSLVESYSWRIGSGVAAAGSNNYDTSINVNGSYDVTLTIVDIYGCTLTRTKTGLINIVGADADFTVVNDGGCVNSQITITDASTPPASITQWTYIFGDGTAETYTSSPITHVYANPGIYNIKLTTRDNFGCIDTLTKIAAATVSQPRTNFSAADTVYCPETPLQFSDSTLGSNLTYLWDFGDGGSSTQKDPLHSYAKKDTVYTVKLLTVDRFGCRDSVTKTNYIRIVSPKAAFSAFDTASICPLLEAKFISESINYDSLYWNFGDGNTSTLPSTSNFYETFGRYTVTHYARGVGGCVDSATAIVNVYNPSSTLGFTYGPLEACNQLEVTFNINPPPGTRFHINFGDGTRDTSGATTLTHTYTRPNTYTPTVTLFDNLDCIANVGGRQRILVKGVLPVFGMNQDRFCDTGMVRFTDFSIGNDSITSRNWNFNDGNTSTDTDPTHFFAAAGTYYVTQTVTTITGCSATYMDTVRVYTTPVPLIVGPTEVCVNDAVPFNATTVVPDSLTFWQWNYGNGQSSQQQTILGKFSSPGTVNFQLKATNEIGCTNDTAMDVIVWPLPVITLDPEATIVVGTGLNMPVSYSPNVNTWTWTPDYNLSCTNCPVPFANPQFTTTYNVAVIDSNNCKATAGIIVKVICVDKNYFIPNTFSPNNDGVNDRFYPRGTAIDKIQSMRIFNRWGELVFERRNFPANSQSDGWDGRIRGNVAAMDAYVYIIEVICDNGEIIPIKGNVTLIR